MKRIGLFISSLRSQKGWVLMDQVVFSGGSFLATVLMARQLDLPDFGVYSSVVLFLYLLLSMSVALITAPFQVLQARESDRRGYYSALLLMQILFCLFSAGAVTGLLLTGISFLQTLRGHLPVILLLMAGFLLQDFFRRLFLAGGRAKQAFLTDLISVALQTVWLVITAWTHTLTLGYGMFIMGITYVPALIWALYVSGRVRTSHSSFKHFTRQHWLQGRWLLLTAGLQWWANNFLVAVSGLFLGLPALGALRLAQTLFGVLNAMLQVLENYALPAASVLNETSTEKMKDYLKQMMRSSFLLLLPVVTMAFLFAKQIFILCGGAQYASYAYVLQGMAILYLFIFLGYPLRIAIRVFLMNRDFFVAYCVSFLFSFLTAKFLIGQWQLTGVVVALIINQILMLGYWQIMLARKNFIIWK